MAGSDTLPLADSLNSRTLLALLFLCERKRKGDGDWKAFIETFAPRLENLSEELRVQVIAAHLMSVEDIDIYDDGTLENIVQEFENALKPLDEELAADPRFSLV